MSDKVKYRLLLSTLEIMVIFFSFGLVNVNSFIRFRQFPEVDNYSDNEGAYIFVAILTYLAAWKKKQVIDGFSRICFDISPMDGLFSGNFV